MKKSQKIKVLEAEVIKLNDRLSDLEELCHEFYHVIYDVPCDGEDGPTPPDPDPNAN